MIYFAFRLRAAREGTSRKIPRVDPGILRHRNLDYQPDARPISPIRKPAVPPATGQDTISPVQKNMSVVDGRTDIDDSIRALAEKYSLEGFTLATGDGLVFASWGSPDATVDAANFGGITITMGPERNDGIAFFTTSCKETSLTGIIRSNRRVPASIQRMIERDTQEILNRWI